MIIHVRVMKGGGRKLFFVLTKEEVCFRILVLIIT